jgi:hypothetical protein
MTLKQTKVEGRWKTMVQRIMIIQLWLLYLNKSVPSNRNCSYEANVGID